MDSKNNRVQQLQSVQQEALDLFERKNSDYGDAFVTYGPVGVIVRIGDKINRLSTITTRSIKVRDENLRDTLMDLHNYAAMAIMLLEDSKLSWDSYPEDFDVKTYDAVRDPMPDILYDWTNGC